MDSINKWFPKPLLLVVGLSLAWGCSSSSSGNEDNTEPTINSVVKNANGIYLPQNCSEQDTTIELVGYLDLSRKLTDVWGYYDAETGREYALAGYQQNEDSSGGLYVIEVTDPTNPSLVAILSEDTGFDVAVWENYAYMVTGHEGEEESGLIYDLSDPANPEKVGSFESGHNIFTSERGYLYKSDPGVKTYDLEQDPTTPQMIWTGNDDNGHDVAVIDDRLFDFHGFDGTILYDVSNPFEPEFIKILNHDSVRYHHSGWTSGNGEYLYINDERPGNQSERIDISVWDISEATMVDEYRDTLSTVHNSYVICDRLVVAYYVKGFKLFDISDPARLDLLDEYDTDPNEEGEGRFLGAWGIFPYTQSGNILVSDVNKGLYLFELSDGL